MPKKSKATKGKKEKSKHSKKGERARSKRSSSTSSSSSDEYRLVEKKVVNEYRPVERVSRIDNYDEQDWGPLTLYNRVKRFERVVNEETTQFLGLNYEIQAPELVNTTQLNSQLMQVREEVKNFAKSTNQVILLEHALLSAETELRNRGKANVSDTINAIEDFNNGTQRLVVNLKCHVAECVRWMDRQASYGYDDYSEIYRCVRNDLVNYHEAVDDEYKALKYFLDEFVSRVTKSGGNQNSSHSQAGYRGTSYEFSGGPRGTMSRRQSEPFYVDSAWDRRTSVAIDTHGKEKKGKKSKK